MKYYPTVVVALSLAAGALLSCGDDDDNPTGAGQQATRATLTHEGFDFSKAEVDQASSDGETIVWMPGGGTHPEYGNGTNVWWRNSHLAADGSNRTRDMGVVELASVARAPDEWDDRAAIVPLLAGHVVVAGCADGFVKFKVVSTDTTGQWPAVVDFVFSADATF